MARQPFLSPVHADNVVAGDCGADEKQKTHIAQNFEGMTMIMHDEVAQQVNDKAEQALIVPQREPLLEWCSTCIDFRRRVADTGSSTAFWLLLALANPTAAASTKGVRCPWLGGTRRGSRLVLALANPAIAAAVTDGARGQGPGGRP
uniref:Uncharacterized protein n=1 Tax=Oryza glumipatula TaxID=40148 RepID=A0A0D9YAG5_9ORYZ